jgi:uncharacterized protein YggE
MRRFRTFAAAILLAGLAGLAASAPGRAAEPPEPRLVTVSGHGEVRAAPDRATVTLGILARAPALESARAEANRVVGALLGVAHELKIAAADVHTTRLGVSPEYDYGDGKRARRLVGYVVQRQLVVELKDIDRLGELLEKGLGAGANLASEPQLDSSRRSDLEREALARAVADARANAQVLARAVDGSVGSARRVTQAGAGVAEPMPRLAMAGVASTRAAGAETYQPGELSFAASVTASFELLPGAAAR